MAVAMGEKIRVYMEDRFGNVTELSGVVASIQYDSMVGIGLDDVFPLSFPTGSQTITITGISAAKRYKQAEFAEERRALEWRCDYCRAINERHNKECRKCGAARPFLYND